MSSSDVLAGRQLVEAVVSRMVDTKAENIAVYQTTGTYPVCDWFVICSGNGPVHCRAIAQAVLSGLKARHCQPAYREGLEDGRWAVLDYVDVVVHMMAPEMREYYDIEQLWRDGRRFEAQEFDPAAG